MKSSHRSVSRVWEVIYRRVFPKRASRQRQSQESLQTEPTSSDISEHTDGFYLYSQRLIEEETQRLAALKLQTSQTSQTSQSTDEMSFASAKMEPYRGPTRPYTIGDMDWVLPSPSPINNIVDDESEDGLSSVLAVFSKVYSIAKILTAGLIAFGVEPDKFSHSDLAFHIKNAEEDATSNSISTLIKTAEELYYALQARLIMEMANVELCSSFTLDVHHLKTKDTFMLPHPRQLYNILLTFKEALDSPTVCSVLDSHKLKQYEQDFIYRSVHEVARGAFKDPDLLGYRHFIMGVLTDQSSSFNRKWKGLPDVYKMSPPDVLMAHSEKYLLVVPKADQYDVPASQLPFVDPGPDSSHEWVLDHRTATLAKLEGRSVGEVRREEDRRTVMDFVRERKCVCLSSCICAERCTNIVERQCPCAERILRVLLSEARQVPVPRRLAVRCSSLARAVFEGLSAINGKDSELAAELDRAVQVFENEVWVQRDAATGI